ncbi:MAG: small basic family protein [Eubacteriales bacterium]
MILAVVLGLCAGLGLGFVLDVGYPTEFAFYITMGLLAALDSIIGACRSMMEGKFDSLILTTGFITNALLAMLLTYMGDKLGVPLYLAAIFVFGGRLFNTLAVIRRLAIEEYYEYRRHKSEKKIENVKE